LATLYTIGHSTRSFGELVSALKRHGIETLADIRAFPVSRRLPHFNRESLEIELPKHGIRCDWMKALGGYRKATSEFEQAMAELLQIAENSRTAYMCAERVFFHCHRMIVSDWLTAHGHEVLHIDTEGPVRPHKLTAEARLVDDQVIYRGDQLF